MTVKPSLLKRFALAALTVLVVIQVGILLLGSLGEAQITSRLELYQTDLLLHATELQNSPDIGSENANALKAVLGDEPIKTALEQYQSVRKSAQSNLQQLQKQRADLINASGTSAAPSPQEKQVQASIQEQQESINQLDIRIGLLQVDRQDTAAALKTWSQLNEQLQAQKPENPELKETVETLMGLWAESPRLLPNAESHIQKSLDGWFRFQALTRLYELQQRSDALPALKSQEQAIAQQSLTKLAIVGTVPLLGSIIGGILLLVLIVQRFLKGQQSLLQKNADLTWEVPWDWETIVQVLILGFFFIGQFIVPLMLKLVQSQVFPFLGSGGGRAKAIYALTYYVTMAIAGLTVLVLSVRPFRPLPSGWFRIASQGSWFLWGLGGYLVALPLMILISLVNQQIWQGQGGSNPLLQIVLEEADPIALGIFFFTAAVAAPIFEETLFRGFLLPSLTRYVPVWGAIALSSLIFAIAHLSLSEVLPLAVLGSVLGIVYTRSRSLLSSMLLHSLWNSATMISLLILGSGAK